MVKDTMRYEDYNDFIEEFAILLQEKLGDCLLSLVLYGSLARGEAKKESDIDLLVILKDASPVYYERLKPILEVESKLRKSQSYEVLRARGLLPYLSFLILSEDEAEENRYIFLDMIEDSKVLIDKDNFFSQRLKELKRRLEILGSKKVYLKDGSWYWDLKPNLKPGEVFEL